MSAPADQSPSVLHSIDWRSVFPFVRIFRAFRVAIQPSKLGLALVAILLIYLAGRALDKAFSGVLPGEATVYRDTFMTQNGFATAYEGRGKSIVLEYEALRDRLFDKANPTSGTTRPANALTPNEMLKMIADERTAAVKAVQARYAGKTDNRKEMNADIDAVYAIAREQAEIVRARGGAGVMGEFIRYSSDRVQTAANAVVSFNFVQFDVAGRPVGGLLRSLFDLVCVGPAWMLSRHPVYTLVLGAWALLVWAVFGGAIARIAAVEVAREEKISIRNALRFSIAKVVSFCSAPLMPLIVVGGIALLLAVCGWLTELRFIGPVAMYVVSAGFVVAILLSVLATLALLGAVGGYGLMYPTIAVEGSDSFDAVSRAFSYVFAKPWRVMFYGLVAIIHGALTYLFLRFLVWMSLLMAHAFTMLWVRQRAAGETSLRHLFATPQFNDLHPHASGFDLTATEFYASGLLSFWTYLFTTLLGAYVLSWFMSASTIVYYLLRADIDATDLDDVYLEPGEDEDEIDEEPAPAPAQASPAPAPPAAPEAPTTAG
jgi:hypothetical protein